MILPPFQLSLEIMKEYCPKLTQTPQVFLFIVRDSFQFSDDPLRPPTYNSAQTSVGRHQTTQDCLFLLKIVA